MLSKCFLRRRVRGSASCSTLFLFQTGAGVNTEWRQRGNLHCSHPAVKVCGQYSRVTAPPGTKTCSESEVPAFFLEGQSWSCFFSKLHPSRPREQIQLSIYSNLTVYTCLCHSSCFKHKRVSSLWSVSSCHTELLPSPLPWPAVGPQGANDLLTPQYGKLWCHDWVKTW